jgi:DNA-binding transcriptional ArsR family regulator
MRDELVVDTPEQLRALAHPLRQRILHLLLDAPHTNKQLATALQVSPPRLHFHVHELLAAGLIELVAERPKRGVLEKYYRAAARVLRLGPGVPPEVGNEELVGISLEAAHQELLRATRYFGAALPVLHFAFEPLRLSDERLARIQAHLGALHEEVLHALADPQRDHYGHAVALTFLLHSLPPAGEAVPAADHSPDHPPAP